MKQGATAFQACSGCKQVIEQSESLIRASVDLYDLNLIGSLLRKLELLDFMITFSSLATQSKACQKSNWKIHKVSTNPRLTFS